MSKEKKSDVIPKLDTMNFSSAQLETLRQSFSNPGGIMVSGPCGSGKQTFLTSYLHEHAKFSGRNTFNAGEIRLPEDLVALQNISKDDLWYGVVHASSGLTALARIKSNIGTSEYFTNDGNVNAIVSTSLISQLCDNCSIPITIESDHPNTTLLTDGKSVLSRLVNSTNEFQYRQRNIEGCEECRKNLVTLTKADGEEVTLGKLGVKKNLLLLSEVTAPTSKLLSIFEECGLEAAENYFNTLFRFESESDCAGELKTIGGLRHLLNGTVGIDEFEAEVLGLHELEAQLNHLEEITLEALKAKGVQLKSLGGFNIVDLISKKEALPKWRYEYLDQR